MKICLECGTPSEQSRCPEHQIDTKPSSTARGYNQRWRRLSEKARRLQPWCSACHTDQDLTVDHSPEAWQRHNAGLSIRLIDVDVLCRSCNAKKGAAR